MRTSTIDHCIVCRSLAPRFFMQVQGRDYWRCESCEATFLDPAQHPPRAVEEREYRLHKNLPDDLGYRQFLSRLTEPLLQRLTAGSSGLDYGCGPGPVLASMFEDAGHSMRLYDPVFADDPEALGRQYDFITCTEVVEHFHHPAREFERLSSLLRSGGVLAIMTTFQTDDNAFKGWHYRRDPTHVVFYRESTFQYLARQHGWTCEVPRSNVVFLRTAEQRQRLHTT